MLPFQRNCSMNAVRRAAVVSWSLSVAYDLPYPEGVLLALGSPLPVCNCMESLGTFLLSCHLISKCLHCSRLCLWVELLVRYLHWQKQPRDASICCSCTHMQCVLTAYVRKLFIRASSTVRLVSVVSPASLLCSRSELPPGQVQNKCGVHSYALSTR